MDWHPFAEKFPLLQGEEWEAFKQSIKDTNGAEDPIPYRLVKGKKQFLDGRNRWNACEELGLKCPTEKVDVPDDEVKPFIIRRNVLRRHLGAEERREIVGDLRDDGKTTREIAETLGVNQSTVVRDIAANKDKKDSEVSSVDAFASTEEANGEQNSEENATPETAANGTVTGRDGKKYKASRKKKPAEKKADKTPTPRQEQPAAESNGHHAKNGAPAFNDKALTDLYGKMVRLVDERSDVYGKTPAYKECWDRLNAFGKAWNRWQAEKEPARR